MDTLLTIAGFDPSSGAGITADLMVFAAHGLFGTACITGLTVQSTLGVQSFEPTSPDSVRRTLDCLQQDLPPRGIKIGMLATAATVTEINSYLSLVNASGEQNAGLMPIVVLDPVMRASSGRLLLDQEGIRLLKERLLPLVDWITPNIDELAVLTGRHTVEAAQIASLCRDLQASVSKDRKPRPLGIIATGGHLNPPNDFLLTPEGEEQWIPGVHIESRSTHGTGCVFSSAFLSRLILGDSPLEAARAAKGFVAGGIQHAFPLGHGRGPLNYFWEKLNVID